jgi:aspartate racemase
MKKIGIVGGVGWQSTMEYYSGICRRSEQWHLARNRRDVRTMPEISIESLDLAKAISCLGSDDNEQSWSQFDEYHRDALKRLEANGADFGLIASNTPHHRFETIVRSVRIPVISILDEMAKESARIGARQVLLLGTALTMRSSKFRETFAKYGNDASGPRDETLRTTATELITDLQVGNLERAAQRVANVARLSLESQFGDRPAVCLACTELPLAFAEMKQLPTFEYDGILFINVSAVHINAAFDFAVNQEQPWPACP